MDRISFTRAMKMMVELPEAIEAEIKSGLRKSVVQVHKTAVEKFGRYQPQVGEFEAWAVLNPEYVKSKLVAGSSGDDPLIGHISGKRNSVYPTSLRQSISMKVGDWEAQVGTNDPIGEWQEFGTTRGIPPRPFLRPALYQNEEWIKKTMNQAIGLGMVRWFK